MVPRPWADLPEELLSIISNFLQSTSTNPIDILCFRAVCKSWRSSSPLPSPKLFHPLPLKISSKYLVHFRRDEPPYAVLSATAVYALHPPITEGYSSSIFRASIIFIDQSIPGKVSIRQPFSQLPYSLPINFPREINLLGFHAVELTRFYNLTWSSKCNAKLNIQLSEFSGLLTKVLLLSNGGQSIVVGLSEEGKLGFLRLGLGELDENLDALNDWIIIHGGNRFRFDDIVEFKGRILGINRRGKVYNIEIGESSTSKMSVIVPPIFGGGGRRKRLVESLGRLFLVVRRDHIFKVYELDEDTENGGRWVEVKSLGDQTLFFGLEFSFSVSADDLHGSCGKNWVVFKEGSFLTYSAKDDDYVFRNVKSVDLPVGVWRLEDDAHIDVIGSHPEYAKVFWPPPIWIWRNELTTRVRILLSKLDQVKLKIPDYERLKTKLDTFSRLEEKAACIIIEAGSKMKDTVDRAKDVDGMLKQIEMFAAEWQKKHCKSSKLRNQGLQGGTSTSTSTSTLVNEESNVPVDSFKILRRAVKKSTCNFDFISLEMMLHATVVLLEEHTSKLDNIVNSKGYSVSLTRLKSVLWPKRPKRQKKEIGCSP